MNYFHKNSKLKLKLLFFFCESKDEGICTGYALPSTSWPPQIVKKRQKWCCTFQFWRLMTICLLHAVASSHHPAIDSTAPTHIHFLIAALQIPCSSLKHAIYIYFFSSIWKNERSVHVVQYFCGRFVLHTNFWSRGKTAVSSEREKNVYIQRQKKRRMTVERWKKAEQERSYNKERELYTFRTRKL